MLEELMKTMKALQGVPDSRGLQGILSRGKNVYNSTSTAAHMGGGMQFGRPAIQRRIMNNGRYPSS
jgi:hypothetical protein